MILGVLAIVIIVGAVVAIVLVNRNGDGQTASPTGGSSEQPPPRSAEKSSAEPPPSSGEPGGQDGWQTIDNIADSGLTYQIPPDWKKSESARPSGLDVEFTGTAEYGVYECQGGSYVRSFATSGDVQAKGGSDLDLNKTVTDFAKSFGTTYFKETAEVDVGAPEETEVSGKKAVRVTAPVTPRVSVPKCEAAKGEIAIIGVLIEEQGKPSGVAMLVGGQRRRRRPGRPEGAPDRRRAGHPRHGARGLSCPGGLTAARRAPPRRGPRAAAGRCASTTSWKPRMSNRAPSRSSAARRIRWISSRPTMYDSACPG